MGGKRSLSVPYDGLVYHYVTNSRRDGTRDKRTHSLLGTEKGGWENGSGTTIYRLEHYAIRGAGNSMRDGSFVQKEVGNLAPRSYKTDL